MQKEELIETLRDIAIEAEIDRIREMSDEKILKMFSSCEECGHTLNINDINELIKMSCCVDSFFNFVSEKVHENESPEDNDLTLQQLN